MTTAVFQTCDAAAAKKRSPVVELRVSGNYTCSLYGREGFFTITITIKNLYSACSQKVSRALRRRLYINIEQKSMF